MRKLTVWVIACGVMSVRALACDVCGCAAPGSSLGILPQYHKHFVGLTYQQQSFVSTHPIVAGETATATSDDLFRSTTLWGRFYPLKRVQVFTFLPYHYNSVREAGHTTDMTGIGDARLLANYMLVNTADTGNGNWKHVLLAGGGIKVPTGRNNYTNSEGIVLSNMQPGTGSWDVLLNANYTLRYRKAGLNLDLSYQFNTVNKRDYLYGNKINAGLTGFAWLQTTQLSFVPQAGLRLQHSQEDWSSYTYRIRNPYSGGYQLYTSGGAGIYYSSFAFTALLSLPAWENYANGLVTSNPRMEAQIQYLF